MDTKSERREAEGPNMTPANFYSSPSSPLGVVSGFQESKVKYAIFTWRLAFLYKHVLSATKWNLDL